MYSCDAHMVINRHREAGTHLLKCTLPMDCCFSLATLNFSGSWLGRINLAVDSNILPTKLMQLTKEKFVIKVIHAPL